MLGGSEEQLPFSQHVGGGGDDQHQLHVCGGLQGAIWGGLHGMRGGEVVLRGGGACVCGALQLGWAEQQ